MQYAMTTSWCILAYPRRDRSVKTAQQSGGLVLRFSMTQGVGGRTGGVSGIK